MVHSSLPFFLVFVRSFQREVQPPWPGQSAIRSCRPMSLRSTPPMAAVCPLRYRDAQLPSLSLPHRQADMVEVVRLRSLVHSRYRLDVFCDQCPMSRSRCAAAFAIAPPCVPRLGLEMRENAAMTRSTSFGMSGFQRFPTCRALRKPRSGRQDDTIEGDGPRRSSVDATRAPNSSRFYSVRFRSGSRTGCAFPRQGGSAAKELPL